MSAERFDPRTSRVQFWKIPARSNEPALQLFLKTEDTKEAVGTFDIPRSSSTHSVS